MRRIKTALNSTFFCLAFLGVGAFLPFFGGTEGPELAVARFATAFEAQDADALLGMLDPEVVAGKDVGVTDVKQFLGRFPKSSFKQEKYRIDKRFTSEDKQTERFQATILFQAPSPSKRYQGSCTLNVTLLWMLENGKWWIERPLSIFYRVTTSDAFPTAAQTDVAARFQATLSVLDKLGLPGNEDVDLLPAGTSGTAVSEYRELEGLYLQERAKKGGVDPGAKGVHVLLKAAGKSQGGLLEIYHGDFPAGPNDKRRPVPWDMFRDYVAGAVKLAKTYERKSHEDRAEAVYRALLSLGRQFLDEPGGLQFVTWGLTFQKQGAEELGRLLSATKRPGKEKALNLANLASRRLDLVQTALQCLDDMAEYRSLQAAITAAERTGDAVFRPWGINTLAILAVKNAPASRDVCDAAGGMVIVENPNMRKAALNALDSIANEPSGAVKSFIQRQKEWVTGHQVYGAASAQQ
jgi:hypothetical protein